MVLMYGDNLYDLDAEFLNKKFIKRHEEIWDRMQKKYEFTDKSVELDEAIYYTKAVLKEQIQKIRNSEQTAQAIKLVRQKQQKM